VWQNKITELASFRFSEVSPRAFAELIGEIFKLLSEL
jgi:c-di-GMP-binding flagellar brake protein YcgR